MKDEEKKDKKNETRIHELTPINIDEEIIDEEIIELKKFELIRAIRGKETFVSFVKNLCESLWLRNRLGDHRLIDNRLKKFELIRAIRG